jgi:hypothetical protein
MKFHFFSLLAAKRLKPIQISVYSVSSFCTLKKEVNNTTVKEVRLCRVKPAKRISFSGFICEDVRIFHLSPPNVNVFQMTDNSEPSSDCTTVDKIPASPQTQQHNRCQLP